MRNRPPSMLSGPGILAMTPRIVPNVVTRVPMVEIMVPMTSRTGPSCNSDPAEDECELLHRTGKVREPCHDGLDGGKDLREGRPNSLASLSRPGLHFVGLHPVDELSNGILRLLEHSTQELLTDDSDLVLDVLGHSLPGLGVLGRHVACEV